MEYIRDAGQGRESPVAYSVHGSLVPVLEFQIDERTKVFFEHYVLLYREPGVALTAAMPRGALRRAIGKMPIILAAASGSGKLGLSRDGPGQVLGVTVQDGSALDVREHQFLAATANMAYGYTRVRGVANLLFGGSGFFIDQFTAHGGPGVVWLHAYGNFTEVVLGADENLDVEPGGWVYKDHAMRMQTVPVNISAGLLASQSFVLNRFHGPGRLGIQSMSVYLPSEE